LFDSVGPNTTEDTGKHTCFMQKHILVATSTYLVDPLDRLLPKCI
jgi:hypothetical protein